jgi:hypothetical protein
VDRATVGAFSEIYKSFKNKYLPDPAYNIEQPSPEGKRPDFFINNLDSTTNRLGLVLNTIQRSPSASTLYVPLSALHPEAVLAKDIVLRAACIQTGCVMPKVLALSSNFCLARASSSLCSEITDAFLRTNLYGLSFTVANLGLRTHPASSYLITLPLSYKIRAISKVTFTEFPKTAGRFNVTYQAGSGGIIEQSSINFTGTEW